MQEPARGVEPLTNGLQNSDSPFHTVMLCSVQTCFPAFKHILLLPQFRCVPFHRRVLLEVLLADESETASTVRRRTFRRAASVAQVRAIAKWNFVYRCTRELHRLLVWRGHGCMRYS